MGSFDWDPSIGVPRNDDHTREVRAVTRLVTAALICLNLLAGAGHATSIVGLDSTNSVECGILQYKFGRLYMPLGEESHIYRLAHLEVLHDSTVVAYGGIEHSYQGVSVSFPVNLPLPDYSPWGWQDFEAALDTLALSELTVRIEIAAVDSASGVLIGTDVIGLQSLIRPFDTSRITLHEYNYRPAMVADLNSGVLDAAISFREITAPRDCQETQSPAPFVAALIPNVGRPCNQGGALTTSLYYRFDESRLPLVFDGADNRLWNRFHSYYRTSKDNSPERRYPYDPERGRALFSSVAATSPTIELYYGSESLEHLAFFFADIIARDRCGIELTRNRRLADLYLDFLPVSRELPSVTMYTLHHRLSPTARPGRASTSISSR